MKIRKQVNPLDVARVLGQLGGTDTQLASALGITRSALHGRKSKLKPLLDTLKDSKAEADAQVEQALFKRAIGFQAPDTHFSTFEGTVIATPYTKHYPPSEVACIFWLKNRKPDQWREKSEINFQTEVLGIPEKVLAGLRKLAAKTAKV